MFSYRSFSLKQLTLLFRRFVSAAGKYKKELNRSNPLGMGGKLAEGYANMIKTMWSGYHSAMAPRDFKVSTWCKFHFAAAVARAQKSPNLQYETW